MVQSLENLARGRLFICANFRAAHPEQPIYRLFQSRMTLPERPEPMMLNASAYSRTGR